MTICEIGNEYYTLKNVPRFDPLSEGIDMAYRALADKLGKKMKVRSAMTKKKAKSKRRISKQSRKLIQGSIHLDKQRRWIVASVRIRQTHARILRVKRNTVQVYAKRYAGSADIPSERGICKPT